METNQHEPYNYKLTEEQFREILFENHGKYAKTADAIKSKYGINFSRQSVFERAQRYTEELRQFEIDLIESAEDTIEEIMKQGKHPSARLKAAMYVINKLHPYWADQAKTKASPSSQPAKPYAAFKIGDQIIVPGK